MSKVNKVKLLSERTSGVPPVIFDFVFHAFITQAGRVTHQQNQLVMIKYGGCPEHGGGRGEGVLGLFVQS